MKLERSLFVYLFIVFGLFAILAVLPPVTLGQTDKPGEVRQEDDDEDDDDEKLTDADKNAVRVSIESARAIALNKIPGRVVEEELEKEKGRLQYAFDIKTSDGKMFDVEVSALTGEVLQAIEEDDDDDGETVRTSMVIKKKESKKTSKVVAAKPRK